MVLGLYVVYDRTAGTSGPVFQAVNQPVALRQYRGLMGSVIDPEDYRLMHIAQWDTDTLTMMPINPPAEVDVASVLAQFRREVANG